MNSVNKLTETINHQNYNVVNQQIKKLMSSFDPYTATSSLATRVVTDIDHFPYTRFYRSDPTNPTPILFEREAGFRPTTQQCYKKGCGLKLNDPYPLNCFQSPCSTVLPCVPQAPV